MSNKLLIVTVLAPIIVFVTAFFLEELYVLTLALLIDLAIIALFFYEINNKK